ncbi:GrdX family protein [Desulfovibrio sp. OttesenSCG-928-M16]|nr:GrdX family protein [Desulfovibrio sp. OttesenSCG-928-M16]
MRSFLPEGSVHDDTHQVDHDLPDFVCHLSLGPTPVVLLAARDRIHAGWKLLNHPLYGNFRPHQQPYRSLLLQNRQSAHAKADGIMRVEADAMSLHLLEEALALYRNAPVLDPAEAPPALKEACAILDCELIRMPLLQAGLPQDSLGPLA